VTDERHWEMRMLGKRLHKLVDLSGDRRRGLERLEDASLHRQVLCNDSHLAGRTWSAMYHGDRVRRCAVRSEVRRKKVAH
jgi:hypothetical protein